MIHILPKRFLPTLTHPNETGASHGDVLSTLILAARPADRVVGLSEFEARYVALEVASGAVGGMDLS